MNLSAARWILVLGAAFSVKAETLQQKRLVETWEKQVKARAVLLRRKCGTDIKALLELGSAKEKFFKKNITAGGYCTGVLEGIQLICSRDQASKAAVQSKIKSVLCALSEDKGLKLSFHGKELRATFGPGTLSISHDTKKWLETQL